MSGSGGFRLLGCGVISEIGSGTYSATMLGRGTYTFTVCVTTTPVITFAGTVVFTEGNGATLAGTIGGSFAGGAGPSFTVTVTDGTKRFSKVRGELVLGPFVQSNQTNCNPRVGVCLDWTDDGPIAGTIRRMNRR